MKKITIKLPGKMILKDCSWLMDEKFRFSNKQSCYRNKKIEIIRKDLNLTVYSNLTKDFCGIHDLQIKIIETGEKFYTRTEFISHCETEKVLFVPEVLNNDNDKDCTEKHRCDPIDCDCCFFSYKNQKLWRETL